MSASLPPIGVDAVIASRVAVTTHVYADCPPPSSAMILGRAFETTVEDRIATNNPSRRPDSASMISRWVIAGPAPTPVLAGADVVVVMRVLLALSRSRQGPPWSR